MLSGSFCYITCHCEIGEFRMTIFVCLFVCDSVVQKLEAASAGVGIPAPLGVTWGLELGHWGWRGGWPSFTSWFLPPGIQEVISTPFCGCWVTRERMKL